MTEHVERDETDQEYCQRLQQQFDEAQWRGGQLNDEHPKRMRVVEIPESNPIVYKRVDNDDRK